MALENVSEDHTSNSLTVKFCAIFIEGSAKLEVIFFFVLMPLAHTAVTHVSVYYL
jgi:hypothetical protein